MRFGVGPALAQSSVNPLLWVCDFEALAAGIITSLDAALTFTRSSSRTARVSARTLITGAGVNVPVVGSNGTAKGVLIEGPRTNRASQSTTMGSPWVTYNGVGISIGGGDTAPDGVTASTRLTDGSGSVGAARYQVCASTASLCTASVWIRPKSGVAGALQNFDNLGGANYAYSSTADEWQYLTTPALTGPTTGPGLTLWPATGEPLSNAATGSSDFFGAQVEVGEYATEWIPTTSGSASRAGDRLQLDAAHASAGGRVEREFKFYPKGAATQYGTDGSYAYFESLDADNHVRFDTSTRRLQVTVAGALWSPATPLSWSSADPIVIRYVAGGGGMQSAAKYSTNGGTVWTDLGTSGAPQGTWPTAISDLMSNGGANQVSAWLACARSYRPGRLL